MASERVPLHLEVSPRVRQRLETCKTLSEAESMTEVVRRALALYELVLGARIEKKKTLAFLHEDDTVEEIVIL